MKHILTISIVIIFFISCKDKGYRFKKYHDVLYEGQCIAIPEYYRRIIGYDSVQFIDFMDKPEANFCYPNKWQFEKFNRDTVIVYVKDIGYGNKVKPKNRKRKILKHFIDTIFTEFPLYVDSLIIYPVTDPVTEY